MISIRGGVAPISILTNFIITAYGIILSHCLITGFLKFQMIRMGSFCISAINHCFFRKMLYSHHRRINCFLNLLILFCIPRNIIRNFPIILTESLRLNILVPEEDSEPSHYCWVPESYGFFQWVCSAPAPYDNIQAPELIVSIISVLVGWIYISRIRLILS